MTQLKSASEIMVKPPEYFRTPVSKGASLKVDRTGGYDGAGVIHGASIITQGEAEGHYMWIDGEFNAAVSQQMNAAKRGVKMRFTHPSLSGDGLGSFLGRAMNARVAGTQVLADLHFSQTAHSTPDGDLASYVMDLAENDPEAFGVSIVFKHDRGAEDKHEANNEDDDGNFKSPDPENKANLPHARLQMLRAADVVDTPAANPSGLFHRGQELASEAEALAGFALGLTAERPPTNHFSLDADRLASFTTRFLDQHGLSIVRKEREMSENLQAQIDAAVKSATDKLSAEHKSQIDALRAELAKPAASPEHKEESQPTLADSLAADRNRVVELTSLFNSSPITKDEAVLNRWIKDGLSTKDVYAEIGELALKQNKLVGGDGSKDGDSKNSEASLRAEYRQYAKLHSALLSEDDWVKAELKARAAA